MTPIDDPVNSQALRRSKAGPINGLASGVKVIGPLTMRLMPPSAAAGTRTMACAAISAIASRSGSSNSMPKAGGTPSIDQGLPCFS